jgi:general secretion pathway protein D
MAGAGRPDSRGGQPRGAVSATSAGVRRVLVKYTRLYVVGMLAVVCVGCGGGSAYHEGQKAALRKDYDTALVDYEKAVKQHPDDARYLIAEKQARDAASFFHLKEGRRFLEEGRLDQAAGEFQKAAAIDPANDAARQELARVLSKQVAAKKEREKELKQAMKTEEAPSSAGTQLKPFPPEPMAHIRIGPLDAKKVFETLAKLGDFNVAFVEGFQPKPISLDLTNVKLEEALRIVGYQTKTFWKPITSNTILVIPDNLANHREFDDLMVKTIYLDNPVKSTDRATITAALKTVLGLSKVVDNPDVNAIIVADTPAKVAAAEKLIRNLDHGKAEVLIEVAIVEADRDRLKDLGLAPQTLAVSGAPEGAIAGVGFTPASASSTSPAAVTINSLKKLSGNDFSVALPSAVATAMMSDTHTRILQNPTIRATDGEKATLKIGTKVPIATGSFLPSYGGTVPTGTGTGTTGTSAGLGLLASTQFQYQDVGVALDITPSVLPDGEVSLKTKIEISAEGAPVNIAGINEPTFTQKNIEHVIRLKEGEASLLGGLNESTVTHSTSGLPFLGSIPVLRYLFTNDHVERVDNEVMVMLTPHVVRLPDVRESNTLVVGSSSAPGLIGEPNPMEAVPQAPGFPQEPQ